MLEVEQITSWRTDVSIVLTLLTAWGAGKKGEEIWQIVCSTYEAALTNNLPPQPERPLEKFSGYRTSLDNLALKLT